MIWPRQNITQQNVCISWWRHQMETFSALLAFCAGNSPVTGEFPAQRPVTRSFNVFFDLRLNKHLSKQPWGWWCETPSRTLWHHGYDSMGFTECYDWRCCPLLTHFWFHGRRSWNAEEINECMLNRFMSQKLSRLKYLYLYWYLYLYMHLYLYIFLSAQMNIICTSMQICSPHATYGCRRQREKQR